MYKEFLTVREDQVGAIIGKGGQKVKEIRSLSGVKITISDQTNWAERVVKMEGDHRAIAMAKHLINIRIELHEASLKRTYQDSSSNEAINELPEMKAAASCLAKIASI